jgi:hypothetical protein
MPARKRIMGGAAVPWNAIVILAMCAGGQTNPGAGLARRGDSSAPVEFNRDIRPIFSDVCYQCHGPDSAQRKANLRLDLESSAKADHDGLRAIAPGDRESSELYRRITSEDAEERMPPVKSGKSLTPEQIERIGRWIAQGARWQQHWAFLVPQRSPVPLSAGQERARNQIDAFILARLKGSGLSPSPEAERGILLRRVSLDLTGLPPSLAEIEAFRNDPGLNAYEKVVDRLLASPRFGERMAIRWLNAARYADTNGYQTDAPRFMWRWRDWVIDAYNRSMPFDQFTIEQLAGDLLNGATLEQRIATGFNRNHRGNAEGGIIPEEYAVEYVVDRVDTTATVWMGLTIGCARCHSHKFDPISQEEYYGFFAFFNNVPEHGRAIKYGNSPPVLKAPTKAQQERLAALAARVASLERRLLASEPEIVRAQAPWETSIQREPPFDWQTDEPALLSLGFDEELGCCAGTGEAPRFRGGRPRFTSGRVGGALLLDGCGYVDAGDVAAFGFYDAFTISAWVHPTAAGNGTLISRMADQPEGEGYAVALHGGKVQVNLVKRWLDDSIRIETKQALPADRWTHLAVTYDGSRVAAGIKVYLDGKPAGALVLLDELNQSFQTREPLRIGAGGGQDRRFVGAIDELLVFGKALDAGAISVLATPESIQAIAGIPRGQRTAGETAKIRACFLARGAGDSIRKIASGVKSARSQLEAFAAEIPTTMVMEEMPVPRATHILKRGQYDQPGARVEPGVPACVAPWEPGRKADRLMLARWLVDRTNPLTARVAVNRDWQMLFGSGLVRTVDDFGAQGEPPTHPELLDWLATEFVRTGWDEKALLRLIVTSATYRQTSRVTPEGLRLDPENRLLARGPRLRLPAELIRDQALVIGGLLVERIGGPSVKPYQPAGLWNELADAEYVQDHGPSLYRRSLYTFWKRTVPPPSMVAFDAPARETCIVRDVRTNTPIQALNILNDVTFVEAARALAERILKDAETAPESRIAAAFEAATARRPTRSELTIVRNLLNDQLSRFRRDRAAAEALVRFGESSPDPRFDPCELAGYTVMAQLILNLDETITKE